MSVLDVVVVMVAAAAVAYKRPLSCVDGRRLADTTNNVCASVMGKRKFRLNCNLDVRTFGEGLIDTDKN